MNKEDLAHWGRGGAVSAKERKKEIFRDVPK